jgi:hypothetical protein
VVTSRNVVLLLVVLTLAVGSFYFLSPGKEKQVRKQLTRLTEYADKEPAEPTLTTVAKAARIGSLFSDPCFLEIENPPMNGSYSRKEVMDRINMARNYFSQLKVSFHDIGIEFPEELRADVVLTMRLIGKRDNEDYTDTREVEFTMEKPEKKWLISRVHLVEVLEQ